MRSSDNLCQTKVIDAAGRSEPCHQPTVGILTIRDKHGRKSIHPVCEECKTAAMEGLDNTIHPGPITWNTSQDPPQ